MLTELATSETPLDAPNEPGRDLELISRIATTNRHPVSLLFVHGINVGGWIWEDHFLDYFADAGYNAHAVSLRGHGQSWGADRIASWTLSDYIEDLRQTVGLIDGPVVLVGHSLGGAVVQKFVQGRGRAAGMALLASVPPWGLAPSAVRMAISAPRSFRGLMEMSAGHPPPDDLDLVRRTLFQDDTTDSEIERFMSKVGPESPRIGGELQGWPPLAPFPWLAPETLVLGGRDDAIVPCDEVWRTGLYFGARTELVPNLGHMLMLGARWRDTAERLRDWLDTTFAPRSCATGMESVQTAQQP